MFIDFLSLVFWHKERDIQFYYADCSYIILQSTPQLNCWPRVKISTHWPNKRAAHPIRPNWTGLAQAQKSTSLSQVQILTNLIQRQISTNFFFQNSPKFPAPRFQVWRHSHYLSRVFIMTFVIVTSSASMNCTPARALSRIVLSLTKLNDKI